MNPTNAMPPENLLKTYKVLTSISSANSTSSPGLLTLGNSRFRLIRMYCTAYYHQGKAVVEQSADRDCLLMNIKLADGMPLTAESIDMFALNAMFVNNFLWKPIDFMGSTRFVVEATHEAIGTPAFAFTNPVRVYTHFIGYTL